jgi:YqjK-like protein
MQDDREQQLLRRREQLVARSAALRGDLVTQAGRLAPLGLVSGGANRALAWVQQHPQWVLGGVALVLVLRPHRLWRWGGRLLAAWQVVRQAMPLWRRLSARR